MANGELQILSENCICITIYAMRTQDMLAKTLDFSVAVIKLIGRLLNRVECWVVGKQVLRSATSIGANYREAQRARSRAEFYSKIQICLQEAEETRYWFEVLGASQLASPTLLQPLLLEASQLVAILVAISKKTRIGSDSIRPVHIQDIGNVSYSGHR